MCRTDSPPTQIIGTQVWAGGESAAHDYLRSNPDVHSVVCLRRTLPDWWTTLPKEMHSQITFYHWPTPDITDLHMGEAILAVTIDLLPNIAPPVLVFCLNGRNRTGVLAGLLRFQVTGDIQLAVQEYGRRASLDFRPDEVNLLQRLCFKQ